MGEAALDEGPVLVPVFDFLEAMGALVGAGQAGSLSTSMAIDEELDIVVFEESTDVAVLMGGEMSGDGGFRSKGPGMDGFDELECAGTEGLEGLDGNDVGMVSLGKGYAGGIFGGSIKLEIDGDSLARLVLLGGDLCNALVGDCDIVPGSLAADRIGSYCWPGERDAICDGV